MYEFELDVLGYTPTHTTLAYLSPQQVRCKARALFRTDFPLMTHCIHFLQ